MIKTNQKAVGKYPTGMQEYVDPHAEEYANADIAALAADTMKEF
jgi:hypothetical protein